MADGFSVQGVEIEGFKGFTTPKIIDFKGPTYSCSGKMAMGNPAS